MEYVGFGSGRKKPVSKKQIKKMKTAYKLGEKKAEENVKQHRIDEQTAEKILEEYLNTDIKG